LLTEKEILAKLFRKFYNFLPAFFFKKAKTLPFYRLFNYKINLFFGKILPYYWLKRIFIAKLRVIRKYFNNYLAKSFICPNTFPIAAPVFLACKPKNSVRVYINYQGFNTAIVKNRYFILLHKIFLNAFCKIKFYIEFNIIVAFNYLYIAKGNK